MWGKADLTRETVYRIRITPTHVGKSLLQAVSNSHREDHPHPCGEKLRYRECEEYVDRITPTHVGKSVVSYDSSRSAVDHPHPCGEKTAKHTR